MNLSITNLCNRRCDYCFQKTWYLSNKTHTNETTKEMSEEEFSFICDWMGKENEMLKLMGGEPLLHSNILRLIDIAKKHGKKITFISNISVDSALLQKVIRKENVVHFLINTDYPESQRELFLTNIKMIADTPRIDFGISSTLLPSKEDLDKSAERMQEVIEAILEYRPPFAFNIRLSPYCPMPNETFIPFDYSTHLAEYFNKIWNYGIIDTHFDCSVSLEEINQQAGEVYEKAGIKINRDNCGLRSEPKCPLDIMIDGSVIWCSSCNYIKIDNYNDYKNLKELEYKMQELWNDEFKNSKIKNPENNCGFCLAKEIAKKNEQIQIKMFKKRSN